MPAALPDRLAFATLEAEDHRFHSHPGVDGRALLRALWQDARSLHVVSGASTIAMQLARLQDPGPRTPLRKLREMIEARALVRAHGHEAVLRHYLVIAPYGHRVRGAARAARLYFDRPVEDLSWLQAAFLAALPQMPGRMDPYTPDGLRRGLLRAHRILRLLRARGEIDEPTLQLALRGDLGLSPQPQRPVEAMHAALALAARAGASSSAAADGAPTIQATLDLDVQEQAAAALRDQLQSLAAAEASNGAVLVVDVATGDVLAQVGSTGYFDEEHHGAIDYSRTRRSPGSALKPFFYALAIESGRATAATELPDTPLELTDEGRAFIPQNMNRGFFGPLLLREALANSRNIPALRALALAGVEPSLRLLERAGVRQIDWDPGAYGLGLALGNLPVTLEELAQLYLMLAAGGVARPLRQVLGDPLPPSAPPGAAPAARPEQLLSRDTAQLIANILSDPLARRPTFAPGGPLDYDGAVAVKTGTSQGHRDAWTVAFTDRLLVAAWVGNHDWRRMDALTGADAAGPLVHRVLDEASRARPPLRAGQSLFPPPSHYETHTICALSGRLAGPECPHRREESFAPGSEPRESCPFHRKLRLDVRNGLRAGPGCEQRFVIQRPMLDLPDEYQAWAHHQHLEVAPRAASRLCPGAGERTALSLRISEPHDRGRYLRDPETPPELNTVRLAARVTPADEEIVWIVDGAPLAQVGWPHEARLPLTPGVHTIRASAAHAAETSQTVTITVDN